MGLFNFDKNKILGTVFQAASNVFSATSRALGSAAKTVSKVSKTVSKVSKTASSIGKAAPIVQPTVKPVAPAPVAPVQVTEAEPPIGKPIAPGSDKPIQPIMPEPIAPDLAALQAEIEKLKAERDFLLQHQADSKPFGAAAISPNADTFEDQMAVKAAIDAKRAANPDADEKETRLQAIDEYYYPEDEGAGTPDSAGELNNLTPGPNPF